MSFQGLPALTPTTIPACSGSTFTGSLTGRPHHATVIGKCLRGSGLESAFQTLLLAGKRKTQNVLGEFCASSAAKPASGHQTCASPLQALTAPCVRWVAYAVFPTSRLWCEVYYLACLSADRTPNPCALRLNRPPYRFPAGCSDTLRSGMRPCCGLPFSALCRNSWLWQWLGANLPPAS